MPLDNLISELERKDINVPVLEAIDSGGFDRATLLASEISDKVLNGVSDEVLIAAVSKKINPEHNNKIAHIGLCETLFTLAKAESMGMIHAASLLLVKEGVDVDQALEILVKSPLKCNWPIGPNNEDLLTLVCNCGKSSMIAQCLEKVTTDELITYVEEMGVPAVLKEHVIIRAGAVFDEVVASAAKADINSDLAKRIGGSGLSDLLKAVGVEVPMQRLVEEAQKDIVKAGGMLWPPTCEM